MRGSKTRILKHFEQYGSLTSMEAFKNYSITRLSARIKDLRDMGYDIDTVMMESENKYGEPIRFAKYVYKGVVHGE